MRSLFLVIITLLSMSYAFARDVELKGETIDLGPLTQTDFQPAHETLNLIRTADSAEKIILQYSLKTQETVCTRYETRPVWVPPYYDTVCHTVNNQQVCNQVYHPGYYDYRQVCVETAEKMISDDKKLYLDFGHIAKLEGNAREVFALEVAQRAVRSSIHDLAVQKIEGAQDYEVKEYTVLGFKRTLKFKNK